MAIIGAVALTLLFGWIAMALLFGAMATFGGFDEVNIPAGIVFTVLLAVDVAVWWLLVGSHIEIGWN